jgi:hypothetical protein
MKIIARLENKSKLFYVLLGLVLLAIVGVLDYLTGTEIWSPGLPGNDSEFWSPSSAPWSG